MAKAMSKKRLEYIRDHGPAMIIDCLREIDRLRRFHSPTCNVFLDDESDSHLYDYMTCTCGVIPCDHDD